MSDSGPLAEAGDLSVSLLERVDRAVTQFEEALRTGQQPRARIEDFLAGVSGPERAKLLLELLLVEVDHLSRSGPRPDPAPYLRRFPAPADQQVVAAAFGVAQPQPPSRIGKYRVVRTLGRGGQGMVYEAVHEQTRRRVAIKVLLPQYSSDPELSARFRQEAVAASQVEDPGIVSIFEIDQLADGRAFMVMEYLDGMALGEYLKQQGGRLPPDAACALAQKIAAVLAVVHDKGIIHRDLKPSNIMLVADREAQGGRRVKILDFGIAKLTVAVEGETVRGTMHGMVLGTPRYMPPEAFERAAGANIRLDDKADVYALGVMLYQFLTGHTPFASDDPGQLMLLYAQGGYLPPPPLPLPPAGGPPLPRKLRPQLDELLRAMLAQAPGQRPAMREVVARLMALSLAPGLSTWSRPLSTLFPLLVPAALGAAALTVLAGGLLLRGPAMRARSPAAAVPVPATVGPALQAPIPAPRPQAEHDAPAPAATKDSLGTQVRFRLVDPKGMRIACGRQTLRPRCSPQGECSAAGSVRERDGCTASAPGYEAVSFSHAALSAHRGREIRVVLPPL